MQNFTWSHMDLWRKQPPWVSILNSTNCVQRWQYPFSLVRIFACPRLADNWWKVPKKVSWVNSGTFYCHGKITTTTEGFYRQRNSQGSAQSMLPLIHVVVLNFLMQGAQHSSDVIISKLLITDRTTASDWPIIIGVVGKLKSSLQLS